MSGPVRLALGEPWPGWREGRQEGSQFQIDQTGATLVHYYLDPSPREIHGARTGKARFALVPGGDHTLFLLYDIEGLTRGWSDAPFSFGLLTPAQHAIQARQPSEGRLLLSILVDAQTGIIHALRGVSLTPAFSDAMDGLIERQRRALPFFTSALHDAERRVTYTRWPDSSRHG